MKATVGVQVKGLKALSADLHTVAEMKPLRELLETAGQIAQETASHNTRRDTGALAGSFVVDLAPWSARMHTPKPYAIPAEKGRKPDSAMPPARALEAWARRHGIANTFLLARSIAKRGIKGRFFRRKARTAVNREMPRLLDRMANALEAGWGHHPAEAD